MNKETSIKVNSIMELAFDEAHNYYDSQLRVEHLLMGVLIDNDNECIKCLKKMSIDTENLYNEISQYLNTINISPKIVKIKKVPPTEETTKLLRGVEIESNKMNSEKVEIEHFFLSMLLVDCEATKILNKINVNYNNFKKTLMALSELEEEEGVNNLRNSSAKYKGKANSSTTPVLDGFCRDITKLASEGKIDEVIGREKEIKRITQILSRKTKKNAILVGLAGVGKSAVVEGLALMISNKTAPRVLLDKKIYTLDINSIVAGTKYRGQFEERMKLIVDEAKENPEIILFIDEIHTIVGSGNSSGGLDVSNILKPALARGELQIIGATTLDEYRENIEKDKALSRRFQQVMIEEPNFEETIIILNNIKEKFEQYHKVQYSEEVILECVRLADRYINDRAMPDKAIDILDEVGAATNVSLEVPKEIVLLEEEIKQLDLKKLEIVQKQLYEQATTLRDNQRDKTDKLEKLKTNWLNKLKNEKTPITVEMICDVVSMMTGIPVSKTNSEENKKLSNMESNLNKIVIGQENAISKITKAVRRSKARIKQNTKPSTFIFLGSTGTGKSMLAKELAKMVYGGVDNMIRFDMSEFMEKHTISKLIGSPAGYVGYEEGGKLTEAVKNKPYSVVLFDEIEKAHPDIFNILLQVLDEGRLTDSLGKTVDFKNTIIILTSNVGVAELSSFGSGVGFKTGSSVLMEEENKKAFLEKALKKKFAPEFLNRIDEVIVFNSLSEVNIQNIISNEINELSNGLLESGYNLKISKSALEFIGKEGYHQEYGARPLKRAIQRLVEDPITDELLDEKISKGDTIKVSFDKTNNKIVVSIEKCN
jgi:ATP-dependent Clp protease ATP-binding subunit ClpC